MYLHINTVSTHKKGEFESCWCLKEIKNFQGQTRKEAKLLFQNFFFFSFFFFRETSCARLMCKQGEMHTGKYLSLRKILCRASMFCTEMKIKCFVKIKVAKIVIYQVYFLDLLCIQSKIKQKQVEMAFIFCCLWFSQCILISV